MKPTGRRDAETQTQGRELGRTRLRPVPLKGEVREGTEKQGEKKEGRGEINASRKECRRGKEGPRREQKQGQAGSRLSRKREEPLVCARVWRQMILGGLGPVDSV